MLATTTPRREHHPSSRSCPRCAPIKSSSNPDRSVSASSAYLDGLGDAREPGVELGGEEEQHEEDGGADRPQGRAAEVARPHDAGREALTDLNRGERREVTVGSCHLPNKRRLTAFPGADTYYIVDMSHTHTNRHLFSP